MSYERLKEEITEQGGSLGPLFRGQQWIEIHGTLTYAQLMALAAHIQKNGKVKVNGNQNRYNNRLGSKSTYYYC